MQFETQYMECISISPSGLAIYREYLDPKPRHTMTPDGSFDNSTENNEPINTITSETSYHERFKNNGLISEHTAKKIRKKINWLLFVARPKKVFHQSSKKWVKFKLCFVTLTLPSKQRHTDQVIKNKCLNQLLIELKRYHGVTLYLWRAEKQQNGNIHFHILTDKFIDSDRLRFRWNRIINKLGYVDDYRNQMIKKVKCFADYYNLFINQGSYQQLYQRYIRGRAVNWNNPNSTDVHSLSKVKNVAAYLSKYMSKNVENYEDLTEQEKELLTVSGQQWGLSESLSKMNNISVAIDSYADDALRHVFKTIKSKEIWGDYFFFKVCQIGELFRRGGQWFREVITEYIYNQLGAEYAGLFYRS